MGRNLARWVLTTSLAAAISVAGCRIIATIDDKHYVEGGSGHAGHGGGGADAGVVGAEAGCDVQPPVCGPGTADCNGEACDGCEANLRDDAANCGRCRRSCEGAACASGMCGPVRIAPSGAWVYDMAVRGGRLYWAHDVPPRVVSASADGGDFFDVAPADFGPAGIAVADGYVYWASLFSNFYGVARAPIDGGTAEYLMPQASYTDRIVLERGFAYFLASSTPSRIGRVPQAPGDAGTYELLWQGAPTDRALSLASDGARLYWAVSEGVDLGVWSMALDGVDVKQDVSLGAAIVVAADADAIYWAEGGGANVWKLLKGESTPVLLADNQPDVRAMRVDADAVYWTSFGAGTVVRANKDGSRVMTLATSQATDEQSLNALALDDAHVYWASGGVVYRTPK